MAVTYTQSSEWTARKRPLDLGQSTLSRPQKAQRVYYGIDVHQLRQEAQNNVTEKTPLPPPVENTSSTLWTEKYRAKKFTDLIGDERTHRAVMHWLKRWDPVVFAASSRKRKTDEEIQPHKKILLLTGPAGLGKTTLAHVCAKQAGYEVQEINASDERSREIVNGRIKDMVGTENVKCLDGARKMAKPICIVVDEVDGAVGGSSGSGEGGFVKALIDLVMADQKAGLQALPQAPTQRKRRFRLMRPIILICNDVYHPALRPLRQSSHAEVIHLRKPQLPALVSRVHSIFEKEGIPSDIDGVRRLCEAVWGVSTRKEDRSASGAGEGDMRSIMVVGQWVASKLRARRCPRLTRQVVEQDILADLATGAARGVGRGATKDIVDRVFAEGAGFPRASMACNTSTPVDRLRQLMETHNDTERVLTDSWTSYPTHPFQDDTLLSKPNAAYEWMHFHDCLSNAVFTSNEWELAPYLSTPVLAFHLLFASQTRAWAGKTDDNDLHPLYTTNAPWTASEARKTNDVTIQAVQNALSLPLTRLYPAAGEIATELMPYTLRMLNPRVNPVVIGGKGNATAAVRKSSEQQLIVRATNAMSAVGVRFERIKVTNDFNTSFIFRMDPALDQFAEFGTAPKGFGDDSGGKTRYAVRQVLEQEYTKEQAKRTEAARLARFERGGGCDLSLPVQNQSTAPQKAVKIIRDFFGRPVITSSEHKTASRPANGNEKERIWITYHEGFSNAVRKPLTLAELMRDL